MYNWIATFSAKTHIDTFNGPVHWLPWEDKEINLIIKGVVNCEEEMLDILKKLPVNS